MVLGLSLRVSWICLLLFSSGACFPATEGDYKYPYTAAWLSASGSAPGSNVQSGGSGSPLASLQHEPSANFQQPAVSVQQGSSPGEQSPSSLDTGSSPSYQPNRFLVTYDPSAPVAPSSSAGYVSPPVGTGKRTPSFSAQSQPAASSSGNSNAGWYGPVYEAATLNSAYPAGNAGPTYENAAATGGLAGPVAYRNPFSDPSISWDVPEGSFASPSAPAARDPSAWMPFRPFWDFSMWDSAEVPQGVNQETSPLAPSSYIVQSRNGYQRARNVYSDLAYSPEYYPPVYSPKTAPRTGSKGGKV